MTFCRKKLFYDSYLIVTLNSACKNSYSYYKNFIKALSSGYPIVSDKVIICIYSYSFVKEIWLIIAKK